MTLSAIENHTKVRTPSGLEGSVCVTQREQTLLDAGEQTSVDVLRSDGLRVRCALDQLEIVEDTAPVQNAQKIAHLKQFAKVNDARQAKHEQGSVDWHFYETVDDIIYEQLEALGD